MKRLFPGLLILMAILLIAVPVMAQETRLTFWTFQELHKQFMDDAVERWNEAYPDKQIVVETSVYPYDDMHNKLLIALQSGVGAPDMADIEINKFANYLKGRTPQLVSLNSVVEPVLENSIEARFANYGKEGNYYGFPYHVGATVMYYNQEIMDQAGINLDDIVTWDDYVEAGKVVVEKTGIPMATIEVTEHWTLYPMISQIGSDIFNEDGDVILDNETNIMVLEFLQDMIYEHEIAIPAPGGFHHAEEYWAFMNNGGAASLMMPLWFMGRFTQYMPDLAGKITIKPLPAWEEGGYRSAGMGGTGTVVTIQSENKDLTVDFLAEARLSSEGSKRLWTVLGFDPVRWDVWDEPEMVADNQYTEYFGKDIFPMLLEIKDEINPTIITEKYPLAVDLLKKTVAFKALRENEDAAAVLKEAADELR